MNYDGPNPELVIPVIRLAFEDFTPASGPSTALDDSAVEYITDYPSARDSCFDHGDINRAFPISDRGLELIAAEKQHWDSWRETGMNWNTLQEHMLSAQVWTNDTKFWSWAPKIIGDIASKAWEPIANKLRSVSSLSEDESKAVGEVISDMLTSVAHARAIRGTSSDYWELIFKFLQLGYWVCGYTGTWPDDGQYRLWYAT